MARKGGVVLSRIGRKSNLNQNTDGKGLQSGLRKRIKGKKKQLPKATLKLSMCSMKLITQNYKKRSRGLQLYIQATTPMCAHTRVHTHAHSSIHVKP